MSELESVNIERHGAVAVVTLNRPQALNAFEASLRRDLLSAVKDVNADESVRVVILAGAGRGFSAGADLTEPQPEGFDVRDQLNGEYKPILMGITNAPKPWISAVQGPAAGIGSAFAMNCDLTVMAENAYLYQAFTAISLIPDGGATWHLVRAIGRKRAYEVILTGEKVSAAKCLDWGLCNRVVPADQLLEQTLAWAQELAAKAPLSLHHAKTAVNRAMEDSVADTISSEAELQYLCVTSEDAVEGVTAFTQKRAPVWKGR